MEGHAVLGRLLPGGGDKGESELDRMTNDFNLFATPSGTVAQGPTCARPVPSPGRAPDLFPNIPQAVTAKLTSTHFYRTAHFKKFKRALEKEYYLQVGTVPVCVSPRLPAGGLGHARGSA